MPQDPNEHDHHHPHFPPPDPEPSGRQDCTCYLEGEGSLSFVIADYDFHRFVYDISTAPGYPAGSNSQDQDDVRLVVQKDLEPGRSYGEQSYKWTAYVTWNVKVPYILTYRTEL